MNTNKKSSSAVANRGVLDDEAFFNEIEALAGLYANEAEEMMRKKVKILKKLPMLIPEDYEPLNTILICRHAEERIMILKEIDKSVKK
jgi:hypothetical protein